MTDRTFYDSTGPADLPKNGAGYLAYTDGIYTATYDATRAEFPGKPVGGVRTRPDTPISNVGTIIDAATGDFDYTIGQAIRTCHGLLADGRSPTIYINRADWKSARKSVRKAGLKGHVEWMVADWTGRPHRLRGSVATQWASPEVPAVHGPTGHFDTSQVAPYWPGVDTVRPGKPLSPVHRMWIRVLIRAWSKRVTPVDRQGLELLSRLNAASDRLKGLS